MSQIASFITCICQKLIMKTVHLLLFSLLLGLAVPVWAQETSPLWAPGSLPNIPPGSGQVVQYPEPFPDGSSFSANKEKFFLYLPSGFDPSDTSATYGAIVFIDAKEGDRGLPGGWDPILAGRKLLFIAPSNVGNKQETSRREGLAVVAAQVLLHTYKLNPNRIYVAGISGGSRTAGDLAFEHPDLFHGTIQSCGTDFYHPVKRVHVTDEDLRKHPEEYGFWGAGDPGQAKRQVHFVLITGPKDFRHNFILDLYEGGFEKEKFKALLLDIPSMGHQICSGDALNQAIDFIEAPDTASDPPP